MGKIKVAFVGIGGYGGVILKEIYETSLEGFEIVAAVEPFPEKTVCYDRICADKIPIYADMETMFAQTKKAGKKPDFVVISTPIQYHTEQILCALRHGAHVLCEKPVTGDIADIPVLEESSRKAGKFLAVGYQWSYSNAIQKLKTDIQNGVFGRAQFLKSLVLWPRDRAYFTRSTGWAGKVFASNGKMIRDSIVNNATAHYIHNILYLLGNKTDAAMPATKVEATLLRTNDIQTFDTATVRFLLEDGAQGLFVVSHCTKKTVEPKFEYIFEKGRIVYPNQDGNIEAVFKGGERKIYGDPFADGAAYKFYKCLEVVQNGGKEVLCGINAAKAQVGFVALLHENNTIDLTDPARVFEIDGRLIVKGLDGLLEECYEENKLLCELPEYRQLVASH